MSNKLLLLGKNGRLAQALMASFASWDSTAVDKEECDLIDLGKVERLIRSVKPSLIINASAITDVDGCESNEQTKRLAYSINGQIPGFIARIAKKIDTQFIHFSTDYVFDGLKKTPYTENDVTNPINVYGKTKLLGETLVQAVNDRASIIRLSWLWGEGKNTVTWIIDELLNKNEITLIDDQWGTLTNAYDLASRVARFVEQGGEGGIFHLPNEGITSWNEVGNFIRNYLIKEKKKEGVADIKNIKLSDLVRPAPRPQYSPLANTKLDKLRSWQESLYEYLQKTI